MSHDEPREVMCRGCDGHGEWDCRCDGTGYVMEAS